MLMGSRPEVCLVIARAFVIALCLALVTLRRAHGAQAAQTPSWRPADAAEAVQALRQPDAAKRAAAQEFLVGQGAAAVRPLVAAARDERGRRMAEALLRRIGAPGVPELLGLLDDAELRTKAGGLLFQVIDAKSAALMPKLLACVADRPEVAGYCRDSLVKIAPAFTAAQAPALTKALGSDEAEFRLTAAVALGRMDAKAASAVPALTKALSDREAPVRLAAARALGQIGRKAAAAAPALKKAAETDENEPVRREAAEALKRVRA